ncbi:MAG: AzlC family ABC transporter permease, partial [Xanthobacteraceae bacterium]
MSKSSDSPAPYWSLEGLALGARMVLALAPGMIAFGVAVGSTAAAKGLSFLESTLMNVFVYAGASQMVALEVWPERMTPAAILALALIAATVNARMLLLGAGLRPWLGPLSAWQTYPLLHLLTDPGWIVAMRYRGEGGSDAAVLLGGSLLILAVWMAATTAGYLLGALVTDPRAIALDLVMPIFFAAMLVPLWRGPARAIPWVVAGAVALLVNYLFGGWWYVVAGALAGSL